MSAHISTDQQLVVETTAPKTVWVIDALPTKVAFSTTTFHAVLTGWATSSSDRTIANLLNTRGEPVQWEGTWEAFTNYGGQITSNPSYLPQVHPEVMHMGLGHVSGARMHSLFDHPTDTAIDFGDDSALQANAATEDAYAVTVPVHGYAAIQIVPDYYTHVLHVPVYSPYNDVYSPSAPIVWSSWPGYYESATEKDILRNARWIARNLKQYGFEYIVLDDGYDRLPDHGRSPALGHAWIEHWSRVRFPDGPKGLTDSIHALGLKAGLWLVPSTYAPALKNHPDWYLYDKQGRSVMDYETPALDFTNPQALGFLRQLFTTLDNFGFDYYKFDGDMALPAYAPPVDRSRLHSPLVDPIETFRERLSVIRKTIGPKRFIEECPAGSPLNAIGDVNSYFNGQDVFENWQGMYPLFSSITGNLFLNHIVAYVMPGEGITLDTPMTMEESQAKRNPNMVEAVRARDLHPSGTGTTLAEARTLVTYVALTGVVYSLASVMPDLPPDRVKLLKATMPTLPIQPIDLFSRGAEKNSFKPIPGLIRIRHFPEVLDLKVNSTAGIYDVAAETNWLDETTERTLSFTQLGLPPDEAYVVFDFWKQQPLGVFRNSLNISIEPHDSRVFLIHPLASRPQLIGNSRHISGTYSIVTQQWKNTTKELDGESSTIAGEPYTLWFHIPHGYTKPTVHVTLKSSKMVAASWQQQGQFASLQFTGADEPAVWQVRFK
ncbi:MAG TPA: alpha-galactosidase [Terracidiphilus sp.]|nr:alpha-galactosidase [Terracidiphilus sp.]